MTVTGIDHIVLAVADVAATCAFYARLPGVEPLEETPGKWALFAGSQKISLQPARAVPEIARNTLPGTANLCFRADGGVRDLARRLADEGVTILRGPAEASGATGPILSIYFHDPDGNLVEVGEPLSSG